MNTKFAIIFVALIFIQTVSGHIWGQPKSCGKNEFFKGCSSSASECEKTCEKPEAPRFCLFNCGAGCDCKDGFLRKKDGKCVLPNEC